MKVIISLALTLVVGLALGLFAFKNLPATWTAFQTIGSLLAVVGYVFWTVARFQLGNSLTVSAQAKQLVTHGLYSRIRNPIYVFGSTLLAGVILFLGHPRYLVIFAIIIPLQLLRAAKESRVLEAAFGDAYRTYRASTWF
jgi:protein-S-isoprenylcysteine O-methyltransferase Ste14